MNTRKLVLWVCLAVSLPVTAIAGDLAEAARTGTLDTVRAHLKQGMDVNDVSADGTSALAHAAHRNETAMVKTLLEAGANVNRANDLGATPLYLAAAAADDAIIEALLKSGANPNAGLLSGETPLMAATNRGRTGTVRLLLDYDADPNASEKNGGQNGLMWAVADRRVELVRMLIDAEADVHARSRKGFTPLMFAAQQGDAESAQLLLAAGADVNEIMPGTKLSPLMIAAASGFADLTSLLLERGAKTDTADNRGMTALHHAAKNSRAVGAMKNLLQHGADPNVRLNHPRGRYMTDTELNMQGATPLLLASEMANVEGMQVLIEAGADPMAMTNQNITALMLASGAAWTLNSDRPEYIATHALKAVKLLVESGNDVNAVGYFGWTPLHIAAYRGENDVLTYLLEQGANPNRMDKFGQTPLSISYAIITEGIGDAYRQTPRTYRTDTANLLLSQGAVPLDQSGVKRVSERASK